ncbi:MAG: hypothetical protein PHE78_05955, partial [Candidatus Gastranaerophilales bacterium]|nr:hypothetical protein [Candidatus Gastranaerophilales bacterium]
MKVMAATAPVAFKGAFHVEGSSDELDEICWYMQKIKKTPDSDFDFVDIRVGHQDKNASTQLLDHFDKSVLEDPNLAKKFSDRLVDALSFDKTHTFDAKGHLDLFLTNQDKKIAETKAVNMVEDSVDDFGFRIMNVVDRGKMLLDNLSQMRNSFSKGKPVLNIKPSVLKERLDHLDLKAVPVLEAKTVLQGLKQGSFDLV